MPEGTVSSEFTYKESAEFVTDDVMNAWDKNGYIIIRNLMTEEEVSKLKFALESPDGVMSRAWERDDGTGKMIRLTSWSHPGNDITGMVARCEKVAGTMEKLLGGEIYHYHTKVIMKSARVGGEHAWHQDYGYWYEYGCMFPYMATSWIAIDKATKENGCVQLLSGSHNLGRIEHKIVGQQVGADLDRVEHAKKWCPLVYAELAPGDAAFFHCNVLHRSDQNRSDDRRWGFLPCYNRADNNPVLKHYHPFYNPMHKVTNDAILKAPIDDLEGKEFEVGPDWQEGVDMGNQQGVTEKVE